jgi:hypothetical protein
MRGRTIPVAPMKPWSARPARGSISSIVPPASCSATSNRRPQARARTNSVPIQWEQKGLSRPSPLSSLALRNRAANPFAAAPDLQAYQEHLATCGKSEAENIRHDERDDFDAGALLGDIDHRALDPGHQLPGSEIAACAGRPARAGVAKILAVSRHLVSLQAKPRRKYLNTS